MMVNINELLQRIAAIQTDLISTSTAKAYFLHTQADFPYWVNRVATIDTAGNSEDIDTHILAVQMYLISGQRTEGYAGESERALYDYVPVVMEGFNERELLESTSYDEPLTDLRWARITSIQPMVVLENSGIGSEQIAAIFTLTVDFDSPIDQWR